MDYGRVTHPKELLDKEGSSRQRITTYRGGIPHVKTIYEHRVRVYSKTEELAEYAKFSKEHENHSPVFKVEKARKGDEFYYIIKVWEE